MLEKENIQELCSWVKDLHFDIASECGEATGFIDGGESRFDAGIFSACSYYDSPYKIASALTYSIANNHCFENCNKRLAFEVPIVFLGYYYGLPVREFKKKDQKYLNDLVVMNSQDRQKEDIIRELADFYREAR